VAMSLALMYAVKATGTLRVTKEGELEGLDIHEHGGPAYPELVGGFHGAGAADSENAAMAAHSTATAK
jgi:ammonium transporter, Amt family